MRELSSYTDEELMSVLGSTRADFENDAPDFSNVSDEELLQIAGIAPQQEAVVLPPEKDFLDKTADNLSSRKALQGQYLRQLATGEKMAPEFLGKSFANVGIGALNDIAGEAISSLTPEFAKNVIGEGIQYLNNKFPALQEIAQGYGNFEKNNPRTAEWLSAFGNTVTLPAFSAASSLPGKIVKQEKKISAADLKAAASNAYRMAESKGGVLKPDFTNKFVNEVEKLKPQTKIGKLVGGESDFTKLVDRVSSIKDEPMSLTSAQELDEVLSEAVDGFIDPVTGKLKKQGVKILDIQNKLRDSIDKISPEDVLSGGNDGFSTLKEARKLWSAQRKMSDIERIINRAEMMDNPATSIKAGFRVLANNPGRMRGYTLQERKLIQNAARSGIISDTFRTIFGSRLIPIIVSATGGSSGIGNALGAQAISAASRGAAAKMQVKKAEKVSSEIAKNALKKPSTTKTGK